MISLRIILAKICLVLLIFTLSQKVYGQTLPVGILETVEDAYRRQQLLGRDSLNGSFMIRPLQIAENPNLELSKDKYNSILLDNFRKQLYKSNNGKISLYMLPAVTQQQINTHHPYGMNDGSMIQARGYQMQVSAGFFAKIGPLSLQLRPEYVFAENKGFQKMGDANDSLFRRIVTTNYYNKIDLPDRFGDGNYSKLSWGQSSVNINAGPVSLGLSNENLWWGPGVRNSLIMTNNASGFKHLSLATSKPVGTYIGTFEAQLVSGRLEQSGITAKVGKNQIIKPADWRYFSGLIINYQPKWLPGLYLDVERSFIVNRRDMGRGFADYFPVFKALPKDAFVNADETNAEDQAKQDQYIAFAMRYVLPESKAEVYLQWGRNDHAYNLRDVIVEPEHTRAYVAGFRKLVQLNQADEFIQIGLEVTQLQKPASSDTRASESWYSHYQVRDGYTNSGQVLGAGIGPASNMQSIDVSWVKGFKKIGLQFDRLVNNNDLWYEYAISSGDRSKFINRHWVDLAFGAKFDWAFSKFIINSQLTYIRSLNYQYQWEKGVTYWEWGQKDVNNLQLKVGLMYRW